MTISMINWSYILQATNKQATLTHKLAIQILSFFSGHHAGLLLQIYGVDKSVHWSAQWASFNKVVNFPESSKRIWNQRRSEDRPLEVFVVNVGTTSGWTDDNKWSHILCYRKVSNMDGWCCVLEGVVELWNILVIKFGFLCLCWWQWWANEVLNRISGGSDEILWTRNEMMI